MMPWPFSIEIETDDGKKMVVLKLNDAWPCPLSQNDTAELANLVEAAATLGTPKREMTNFTGHKITVWCQANRVLLDFSSPHAQQYTVGSGDGGTISDATKLALTLRAHID